MLLFVHGFGGGNGSIGGVAGGSSLARADLSGRKRAR
jgi:hypothetical protein